VSRTRASTSLHADETGWRGVHPNLGGALEELQLCFLLATIPCGMVGTGTRR
jgi:hypothetical protein